MEYEETREGLENQMGGVWGKVEVIILRVGGEQRDQRGGVAAV
jgi:hypothetical protein